MGGRGSSSASARAPFNEHNYFMGTAADFKSVQRPDREPDYVSYSGSEYWYSEDGVVRGSNHWGTGIASTDWFLDGSDVSSYDSRNRDVRYGKAKWTDFVQNADYTYIEVFDSKVPKSYGKPSSVKKTWDGRYIASYKVAPSQMADRYVTVGKNRVKFSDIESDNRIYSLDEMLERKRSRGV